MTKGEQHRYDLLLMSLAKDKLQNGGRVLTNWLNDLNDIAAAPRIQNLTGMHLTREWLLQQAFIQAVVSNTAFKFIGTGTPDDMVSLLGGIIHADMEALRLKLSIEDASITLGAIKTLANFVSYSYANWVITSEGIYPQVAGYHYATDNDGIQSAGKALLANGIDHIYSAATVSSPVTITGTVKNDFVSGSNGNDVFIATPGTDWYYGAEGSDTINFSSSLFSALAAPSGITIAWGDKGFEDDTEWGSIKANVIGDFLGGVHYSVENIVGTSSDDTIYASSYTKNIYGGGGSDTLYGGSASTHLWGGAGADKFNLSNKTFVEDAETKDQAYMYGIRLSGGVAQWWSDSGWAYWAPVSSLMMPATMGILGGLVLWADVTRALAFRYGFSATGQLIVQTALGLGGQAVIEKYELDLDTGAATGGVVAFQQNLTRGSLATLTQYLNLALKAGGFGGFMGLDPLVLDLDGDGVELTREDSSKVYFEFDTDGFGERCGWVDAAVNDNLPPQHLTRRRAA